VGRDYAQEEESRGQWGVVCATSCLGFICIDMGSPYRKITSSRKGGNFIILSRATIMPKLHRGKMHMQQSIKKYVKRLIRGSAWRGWVQTN